jgi:tetratricopeptide (TPR) repeat protein
VKPDDTLSTGRHVPAEAAASHAEWIAEARQEVERWQDRRREVAPQPPRGDDELLATLAQALPGYAIDGFLQSGGQGVVYRAVQRGTGRKVAIKVMRGGRLARPSHRARFEREVRILARLRHPNIVTILDSGTADGQFYYIMDFIDGPALDEFTAGRRLPVREIVALFVKICGAIHAAHLRGIIHRDLKPSNVRVDAAGEPHILDFGLAKLDDVSDADELGPHLSTLTGEFIGSPPWASPEQVDGLPEAIDVRTDVYSLGVMLYQCLTGTFPYRVDGRLRETLDNICNAEPARPARSNRAIDDDLEAVVLTCLRKSPAQRYQTAGEVGRDLQGYLAGEPVEAKRDSSWYLLRMTVRRHRVTAALTALAAVLAVIVALGSTVMYRREARLRGEAQAACLEAVRQTRIAEAVNTFLNEDLLAAARPDALGRNATIEMLIDAAAGKIEGRFDAEPQIEAAIRQTVGDVYMELGKWAPALAQAERALALLRASVGAESEQTLAVMNLVGRLYRRLGRYQEADATYSEMLAIARRALGEEHALTQRGMNNHAYVLHQLGRTRGAYELNRRVLEFRLRTLGPEHEETLTSMNNNAYYVQAVGTMEEAAEGYEKVFEIRRRVLGPEHPDTLLSMHNVATLWSRLGRLDDAARLEEEQLELVRKVQGPRHAATMDTLAVLGDIYRRRGRFDEAERLLNEALDIQREVGGAEHPHVAWRLDDLAELYRDQGRYEEAEATCREALALLLRTVGENHFMVATLRERLGRLLVEVKRLDEAEPLLLQAYYHLAAEQRPDDRRAWGVAQTLAGLYASMGDKSMSDEWSERACAPD